MRTIVGVSGTGVRGLGGPLFSDPFPLVLPWFQSTLRIELDTERAEVVMDDTLRVSQRCVGKSSSQRSVVETAVRGCV